MKKVNTLSRLLMLCFGVMLTFGAAAQGGQGQGGQRMSQEERAAQQLKTYKEQLKLTDDQVVKLEAINKRSSESMRGLRDQGLSREDMMAKRLEMQKKTDEEITAILNDDQKKQYATMVAERQERMRQFQGGQGGQAGGQGGNRPRNNN